MEDLNEKVIIKLLSLGDDLKKQLLDQFDSLDPDRKAAISQMLWDTYDALYELKLQENIEMALKKVETGEESMDEEFYTRIHKQTEQEMTVASSATAENVQLEDVRSKLQTMLQK